MKIRTQFIEDTQLCDNFSCDLDEMESMIAGILSFARDDAAKEKPANVDLVSLLNAICDDAQDLNHKVNFQTHLKRALLHGRLIALKRAFVNLINNAVRYGNCANVSLYMRLKQIHIKIEDSGPGIPEQDLKKVFEPFYRGERSRSRDTGGTGLGLSVAQDIIRAHGGKIKLSNIRHGGLKVLVQFPTIPITANGQQHEQHPTPMSFWP